MDINNAGEAYWEICTHLHCFIKKSVVIGFLASVVQYRHLCDAVRQECRCAAGSVANTGCIQCSGLPVATVARCGRILSGRLCGLRGNARLANLQERCPRSGTCCSGAILQECQFHKGMAYNTCNRCKGLSGIASLAWQCLARRPVLRRSTALKVNKCANCLADAPCESCR